jgi:predicted membrane protein DUF2231
MFDTIFGLPVHPLVVHATVVIVPAAVLAVALAAAWRPFRRWAGPLPLLLSAAGLVLVPLSTSSGEALERRVPETGLLQAHTRIAEGLLLPVAALTLAAAALYWLHRRERRQPGQGGGAGSSHAAPGRLAVVAILLVAAVGTVSTAVQVARIGHSGAEAAWAKTAQTPPRAGEGGGEAGGEGGQ